MKSFTSVNNKNIHNIVSTITQFIYASDNDVCHFYPLERDVFFDFLIKLPEAYAFEKFTNLHGLIYYIEDTLLYHGARRDCMNGHFYEDYYLNIIDEYGFTYDIDTPGCKNWIALSGKRLDDAYEEDIRDYYTFLENHGIYQNILNKLTEEAFHILFSNRAFLFEFNKKISKCLTSIGRENLSSEIILNFKNSGGLKRKKVPKWAERAIYFRDRGRCTECNKDLSGILSMQNKQQLDHIIPLEKHGINCVTNLQLMCDKCNLKKGISIVEPSSKYESWY